MRIDTVENGLRELCHLKVEGEGYDLSHRIIRDNLTLGISAIADSCNTLTMTREAWEDLATESGAIFHNIEISCSDISEHESRVNLRNSDNPNSNDPSWQQVKLREYEQWGKEVIKIDTAEKSIAQSFSELCEKLGL